ncbi:hormone-sensitive lipase-like isoform X2 [Agelaius tricolor]|uniref:hormone-sensitive lipase-like isoform X2 n=1 Tax=Agelaius tricolor TaxID=9191 RepID=UPI0039F255E7
MDLLQSLQILARDNLNFFSPPPTSPISGLSGAVSGSGPSTSGFPSTSGVSSTSGFFSTSGLSSTSGFSSTSGAASGAISGPVSSTSRRFADAFSALLRHGRHLGPALSRLSQIAPNFDLDPSTPGNGYRSLLQVVQVCLERAVERSRYVALHRRSLFFRAGANAAEIEAVAAALGQLRALTVLALKMAEISKPGCLFPDGEKVRKELGKDEEEEEEEEEEEGISEVVLREYSTMHNGCFYGRCLGFQFVPSLRPFLQTLAIGLVSFGENYGSREPGLGVAAGSLFTSGKFALDPELRGAEFERLTQNLDVHFWKSFWNLTETELLASMASLTAVQVGLCRALAVPPEPLELPLGDFGAFWDFWGFFPNFGLFLGFLLFNL